jgi:hypothetical protein
MLRASRTLTGLDRSECTMAAETTDEQIQRLLSAQRVGRLGMIEAGSRVSFRFRSPTRMTPTQKHPRGSRPPLRRGRQQ